jgi:hypothetical protein
MAVEHVCQATATSPAPPLRLGGSNRVHWTRLARQRLGDTTAAPPLTHRHGTPTPRAALSFRRTGAGMPPRRVLPLCPAVRRTLASKPRHRLAVPQQHRRARPILRCRPFLRRCTN